MLYDTMTAILAPWYTEEEVKGDVLQAWKDGKDFRIHNQSCYTSIRDVKYHRQNGTNQIILKNSPWGDETVTREVEAI
jgi:hypothetical protein